MAKNYDTDGHSHSYLTIAELKECWVYLQSKTVTISGMKDADGLQRLEASIDSTEPTDWTLLYPYCKWTTEPDAKEFELEVPASFSLSGVEKIINLFETGSDDDHRIVFWFDN